jgi:hypothetical protein
VEIKQKKTQPWGQREVSKLVHAEQIRKKFSKALREALVKDLGRLPPASYLSRHFNLRARGVGSISQESARRWMRGLSVPSPDKLSVLASWMRLDIQEILSSPPDASQARPQLGDHTSRHQPNLDGPWNTAEGTGTDTGKSPAEGTDLMRSLMETDLMRSLMDLLSQEERQLMTALMQRIAKSRNPETSAEPIPNGVDAGGGEVNRRAAQWPPKQPS